MTEKLDETPEIEALRKVNEAASDYLMALDNDGFAAEFGGVDALLQALREAQYAWEAEFNTLP